METIFTPANCKPLNDDIRPGPKPLIQTRHHDLVLFLDDLICIIGNNLYGILSNKRSEVSTVGNSQIRLNPVASTSTDRSPCEPSSFFGIDFSINLLSSAFHNDRLI
ncbi:hypothetical protein DERP_011944 [Dermatophagoides pteronyssinus]|uniref:Uncharacterized protein n=1 Tax=Dermatophagoides pteronyssinus TaxID=6956 RepID=A0ABQ8J2S0_DERPT|nr:hypothetical protein DERP_011944 [Dermatophagoides pteronyssinus]